MKRQVSKSDLVVMELKRILILTFGAAVMAFNIKSFVNAGGLYPGGFSGVTILLQRIFLKFFGLSVPYTFFYIPLNAIPAIIGFKYIGRKFTIYSFYVICLMSLFTDIIPSIPLTYDVLLICVFGGIINGIAIAICLNAGASCGGTDFISIYYAEKNGIDAWNYIFAGNVVVLLIAGALFGLDKALYSVIFQFATTQILNIVYKRYQKHTLWIITEKEDEVYNRIKAITNHDATLFKGIGCYKGVERNMLYSVVSSDEVPKVLKAIKDSDPKAFVNVTKTEQVDGRFYQKDR